MAAVFAQFTTPFEIRDDSLQSYTRNAYLRMPRDKQYRDPDPDRASRGWIVVRARGGNELFRTDVNLFMDGGIGVTFSDAAKLSDALVNATATLVPEPVAAAKAIDAILGRLEAMHSPWAVVNFAHAVNGMECFHEDKKGQRTGEKYLIDLRLERITPGQGVY